MQRTGRASDRRFLTIAVCALLLASCSNKPLTPSVPEEPLAQIEIVHLGGSWRVTMTLPEPVDRFVFYSTPQLHMRESWLLKEPHLRINKDERRDVIESDTPFSKFTLMVRADNRLFPGGYSLTQDFVNEGWILYTGHFLGGRAQACPEWSQNQFPCGESMRFEYSVIPQADENLWWQGEIVEKVGTWTTDEFHNAFAYFGPLVPEKRDQVQWLIPSDFPKWIEQETQAALPVFIKALADGYGQPIEDELTVVMNRGVGDGSFSASVLRDIVQLELRGDHWLKNNERGLARLLETLAHETAHLWNGGRYKHDHATGQNWMHEGGATAAASILMRDRGQSLEEFFFTRSTQLNNCIVAVDVPLREFGSRGRYPWYYSCGAIIELIIESALRRKNLDGFAHWRKMYADLEGRDYDIDAYLEAVSKTTEDLELAGWIRSWTENGLANGEVLVEKLQHHGLAIEQGPTPGDHMAAVGLVRPLIKADCEGSFSISSREGLLTLHGMPKCEISKEDFVVDNVLGFSMPSEVKEAYDQMQKQCGEDATVEITGRVEELEVVRNYPCERAPVHLKISGWQ